MGQADCSAGAEALRWVLFPAQAGLELVILKPQTPECRGQMYSSMPSPTLTFRGTVSFNCSQSLRDEPATTALHLSTLQVPPLTMGGELASGQMLGLAGSVHQPGFG